MDFKLVQQAVCYLINNTEEIIFLIILSLLVPLFSGKKKLKQEHWDQIYLCPQHKESCCLGLGLLWLHALNILQGTRLLQSQLVSTRRSQLTLICIPAKWPIMPKLIPVSVVTKNISTPSWLGYKSITGLLPTPMYTPGWREAL